MYDLDNNHIRLSTCPIIAQFVSEYLCWATVVLSRDMDTSEG